MSLRTVLLVLWVAMSLYPINVGSVESPQLSNEVDILTEVLEIALKKPNSRGQSIPDKLLAAY